MTENMETGMPTQIFVRALDLSVLGMHARKFPDEYREAGAALRWIQQSINLFASLNIMQECSYFPENPRELFEFLATPMDEFVETLPENWQEILYEARIHHLGTMIEKIDSSDYYLEDGFEYLRGFRYHKILDSFTPGQEYIGQKLYVQMCNGSPEDYICIRGFLSDPRNRFVPMDQILQTPEQVNYFKKYPLIKDLAYTLHKLSSTTVDCCPNCGAVLEKSGQNGYRCVGSRSCNEILRNKGPKRELVPSTELWIPNSATIHNIYCPGQLERKIEQLLSKYPKEALTFKRWPDKDRVDFVITFSSEKTWGIDAKMTTNAGYILKDAQYKTAAGLQEDKLFYILPNHQKKSMLNNLKKEVRDPRISCVTFNEFAHILKEEVNHELS